MVKLPCYLASTAYWDPVHGHHTISDLNPSPDSGTVRIHTIRNQVPSVLHPQNAIIGRGVLASFAEADPRQRDRSYGQQHQKNGRKPNLKIAIHRTCKLPPRANNTAPLQ